MPAPLKIVCFVLLANGEFLGLRPKLTCLRLMLRTFRIQNRLTIDLSFHLSLMFIIIIIIVISVFKIASPCICPPILYWCLFPPMPPKSCHWLRKPIRFATQKICISHANVANISSEEKILHLTESETCFNTNCFWDHIFLRPDPKPSKNGKLKGHTMACK